MRSQIASTSSRKCEMNTMLCPASRSRRSKPNSRSISGGESADVGSSRIIMRAPENSTRATSTSCCRPSGRPPILARGSTSIPRFAKCSRGAAPHRAPVDQPEPADGLRAEMDVLRHAQFGHHGQFLVHHADPRCPGIARRAEMHRMPIEPHLALILGVHAGDDLHQRGFARAVLADKPMDLAGRGGKIHRAQGRDAAERLGDPGKFQQRRRRYVRHGWIRSGNVPPSTSFRVRLPW